MEADEASNSSPSSGSERTRLFATLRSRYQAMERDIVEEFPDYPKFKRTVRRWVTMVLVVIVAGIVLVQISDWRSRREQARRRAERAKIIQLISPVEDIREDEVEFVWRPSPIAEQYVVELSDNAYNLVWRSEPVTVIELKLPGEVRRRLLQGRVYHWQIRGFNRENTEVASSPIEEITVIR